MKNDGFTFRKRMKSFRYAFRGIYLLVRYEHNAWIHCAITACVLAAGFLAGLSRTEWVAIVLCGIPIILEAIIGLVTAFDIKADVLVSLALIASVCIGETFAAGEVAFIMQLGGLLEELTVAKARAGIEKLVHLTPQTARVLRDGREEIIPA